MWGFSVLRFGSHFIFSYILILLYIFLYVRVPKLLLSFGCLSFYFHRGVQNFSTGCTCAFFSHNFQSFVLFRNVCAIVNTCVFWCFNIYSPGFRPVAFHHSVCFVQIDGRINEFVSMGKINNSLFKCLFT